MAPQSSPQRRWPAFPPFFAFFAIFALLGTLWSLATPIFASPDESAHATKAVAQLRGEFAGYEREGVRFPVIDLPNSYRYSEGIVCFVPHPAVPANCGVELGAPDGTPWFGNWVLSYNPLYYYVVGWPTLFLDGNTGVYAMRILSALLGAVLLSLACQSALSRGSRRWMPLALAFLASPMVLFLSGSVNPQGVEITAGALSWIAIIRLFESYRDSGHVRSWRLWAPVVVGALFLIEARAVGPLWWLIIAAVALGVVGFGAIRTALADRRAWPWMGAVLIFAAFSAYWTLKGGSVSGQAAQGDAPHVGGSPIDGFWATLRNTPTYVEQAIGLFGWLDTPLPGLVLGLYLAAVFVVVLFALLATGRRGGTLTAVTLGVAALVPPLVQAAAVSRTGVIWQGRYSLFLYLGIVIVACWSLSRRGDPRIDFLSIPVTAIISGVLGVYGIAAFVLALRRYVVGNDTPITGMVHAPLWQPPFGWPVLVVLFVAVTAVFTGVIAVAARRAADQPLTAHSES